MSNNLSETMNELLDMELEALEAIYLHDIHVVRHTHMASIRVDVYPKTGHKTDDQFVRLTLAIKVPKNYPNEWPVFEFNGVRGLTDDKIERIKSNIESVCESKSGETVLYEVIEKCRDMLTALNFPLGTKCAICLYEFSDTDQLIKNECFHHLHSRCFADYVVSTQKSQTNEDSNGTHRKRAISLSEIRLQCPVCRIELNSTDLSVYIDPNKYSLPYLSEQPLEDEQNMIEEAKRSVKQFDRIYEKQLKNGGIIDVENEKNKYFIRISDTSDETAIS